MHGKHLLSVNNLQKNPQQYGLPIKRVQSESDISACHDNHVRHSRHSRHKSSDNLSPGFSKVSQVKAGISPFLTAPGLAGHAPPDSRKVTRITAVKTLETKASSFDFQFVNSTNQVRKILTLLTGNDKSVDVGDVGDVIVVTHPDDLSQDHLVHRLKITEDGHPDLTPGKLFESDVQLTRVPGRSNQKYDSSVNVENKQEMPDISSLSSGKKNVTEPDCSEKQTELHHSQPEAIPLTLVLDVRALTSAELPRFNDLLDPDSPCLYDKVTGKKRPLGQHVKLLVLVDPKQLAAVGSDDKAPGADFWRRINRPGNTWQGQKSASAVNATKSDSAPLLHEFPGNVSDHSKVITIDCHLHHDWRQLLFGGPGVDDYGKIQHLPGKLKELKSGQSVILKGANWQDLAFEQSMRLLKARKQYVSNGETIKLPKGVEFYRAEVAEQELAQLFQRFAMAPANIPDKPVVINQSNLPQWLNGITINEQGYAQKNTSLQDQIAAGGTLTVTSPLSEDAWFQLLGTLDSIRKHTGLKTSIFVAHPKDQPKSLQLDKKSLQLDESRPSTKQICSELCRSKGLKVVTYQQETQAAQWLENHASKPQMFQVNAQTTLAQLFDNLYVISEKRAQFGRHPTDLQKALHEGDPVVLQGLETNPTLQQVLEPLCCGQPLLVNGVLQSFPNANITLLWPTSTKCSSPLWRQLLASADQCPEPDIWVSAALRNGIERDALPEKAINGLYQAFSTVPRDLSPTPGQLPALTAGLLANLIQAAGQAGQLDQAESLEPVHWRKAINSVLTHGTRQNPAVRDFMKFACEQLLPDVDPSPWVDSDRLAAVLADCQRLDRNTLEKQIWQLARAFHPGVFKHNRFIEELSLSFNSPYPRHNEALDALCALVAAHAPEKRRDVIACQLEVTPQALAACQQLPARPGRQIKRLEDALYSGWSIQSGGQQTRSALINHLAKTCFDMARDASADEASRKHQIKTVLEKYLIWTGSKTAPLEALVDDLYRGHIGQQDREQRRLHRLKSRLAESPVIFLQGETGTGKSYFSAKMARAAGSSFIVSIGPSTSEESLMKRWAWQESGDGDRVMEQQKQILLQWAETVPSSDDDYVTLVLDEANLASPQLLTTLKGLWQQPPCVYISGHPVPVSLKHRVILSGNPDHYAGRQLDPTLKDKMQRVYYPPLDRPFLQDCVIEPALRQHLLPHMADQQARALAQQASSSVLALWQYYPELLPDHEFTPRDLTDICAWVGWYLNQPPVLSPKHPETSALTREQIHALVLQGFRSVLNPELSENQKEALAALEIWFAARYPTDNALVEQAGHRLKLIGNYFRFETGIHKPEFDTSAPAVSELVQQLGQDLSRCQQAWHSGVKHGGRQATLIEGPAGRGKDVTLQLLIDCFRQQVKDRGQSLPPVRSLNACDCSWETLCSAIAQARAKGGILIISELNLIDSQHLEGELNDILAGDAHPGFHLFATTNPPQYSGRKPLSPALKGRFRHLPIRKYNRDELTAIAQKTLPDTPNGKAVALQLSHWHCQLRRDLRQKYRPLQPTSLDLLRLAGEIARSGDFSEQSLRHHTSRHYRLYLMAARCTLKQLPDRATETTMASAPIDRELCQWFSGTLSVNRPWLIRRGTTRSIHSDRHQITVPAHLEAAAARQEVIKMVAEERWWESGLSPDPDPADDTLTQALYRCWQHRWFNRHFADTGVQADKAFPLSEAQALAMEANQPYLTEVDRLVSEQILNTVNLWPTIWATVRDRIYYPARHYHQQVPVDSPVASVQEDFVKDNRENLSKFRKSTRNFIKKHPGCGRLILPALPIVGMGLLGHGIYKNIRKKSSTHKLGSSTHKLDSSTHKLDSSTHKPDASTHKLDSSTHRLLDKSTAYQAGKKLPTATATNFFDSHHGPGMYRLSVNDINVKPDGNIYYPACHYHQQVPVDSPVASVQEDFVKDNRENLSKFRKSTPNFIKNHPGCGRLILPALPIVGMGLLGHGIYKNIRKKSSTHKLGSSTHKLDSSTHKLDFSTHKLDSSTHKLDASTHKSGASTHKPDSSTHRLLDKSTAYQAGKKLPTVTATNFFDSHHSPAMYRLSVNDINVKPDGNIEITRFKGISGFKTVTPRTTWSEQGPILLAWGQTLASVTVQAMASDWLYLPSLNPDETIIALRTEPAATCQIRKDCYTGLHSVNFSELPKNQNIQIDYVVESRAPETMLNSQYTIVPGDTEALTAKRSDATCTTTIKAALDTLFDRKKQVDLPKDQQQLLWSISNPDSYPEDRISAISAYCQEFRGQSNPKPHKNFFQFLIRSRQGACRHRAPVFVAMCRYFGIPARVVENDIHTFPEYSLDNGRSWQSQDLGGEPGQVKYSKTKFPPSAKTGERLSQRQNALLKNASPAQKETCAKALGLSTGKFNHAIENSLPLLSPNDSCEIPMNEDVTRKLWGAPNEACFVMGAELLIASDQLSNGEGYSAGNQWIVGPLEKSIMSLLCSGAVNTQLITETLDKLYSRMFKHGAENKVCWMRTIVSILNQMFDKNDKVVTAEVKQQLSLHASESGWLTPELDKFFVAMGYLRLLQRMKKFEELAPLATTCLQKWYDNWLGRDRYSDIIDCTDITNSGISNNHGGVSAFLESTIFTRTLTPSWTDEPEGVPNIERLLTRNPAFPLFGAKKTAHRPVIIMGSPDWYPTSKVAITDKLYQRYLQNHPEVDYLNDKKREYEYCLWEKDNFPSYFREGRHSWVNMLINCLFNIMFQFHFNDDSTYRSLTELRRRADDLSDSKYNDQFEQRMNATLLEFVLKLRVSPEEKNRLDTIKNCFDQSIQLALSHYLYEMAHSKGGRLLVCWIKPQYDKDSPLLCGYHEPSSPEELASMLSISHYYGYLDHNHLLNTHNATNGVILTSSEITKIAQEFIDTVEIDSLYDEVCQHLKAC